MIDARVIIPKYVGEISENENRTECWENYPHVKVHSWDDFSLDVSTLDRFVEGGNCDWYNPVFELFHKVVDENQRDDYQKVENHTTNEPNINDLRTKKKKKTRDFYL